MNIHIEQIEPTAEGWKVYAVDTLTHSPLDMNVDYGDLIEWLADGWECSKSEARRRFGYMDIHSERDQVKEFFIQSVKEEVV